MAKQKQQSPNSDFPKEVETFFKENPTAKSVIHVEGTLFLNIHVGAAKDYALRNNLKMEEIKNPFIEKPLSEDIKED